MRETDWKFDFSTLPHWENRNSVPYVYDEFLELPQSDTLCCIYSVAEVSMGNYLGFLAIIKNKKNPSLFLNIAKRFNFSDNISANSKGSLIFLQPSIYYKETNSVKRPILIIDIEKECFSYLDTDNCNPCYKVAEKNENVFAIVADGYQKKYDKRLNALSKKKIRINRLIWHELAELDSLPEQIIRENYAGT